MALTKDHTVPLDNGVYVRADIHPVGAPSPNGSKLVEQMILQLESRRAEIVDRLSILHKLQKRLTN